MCDQFPVIRAAELHIIETAQTVLSSLTHLTYLLLIYKKKDDVTFSKEVEKTLV